MAFNVEALSDAWAKLLSPERQTIKQIKNKYYESK